MTEIDNSKIQPDVQPSGLPTCSSRCPSHDGKRCEIMGRRPEAICEPRVIEMSRLASRPADADRLGPLDYFALMLLKHETGRDARWIPIPEETKIEYREKARLTVASWAMDELMEARK